MNSEKIHKEVHLNNKADPCQSFSPDHSWYKYKYKYKYSGISWFQSGEKTLTGHIWRNPDVGENLIHFGTYTLQTLQMWDRGQAWLTGRKTKVNTGVAKSN